MPVSRDVLEERRHSPFQVLDASAIEGIRRLAGESSSIYSCIQIYKALTPPAPPAYRGATEGLLEERREGRGLRGGGSSYCCQAFQYIPAREGPWPGCVPQKKKRKKPLAKGEEVRVEGAIGLSPADYP